MRSGISGGIMRKFEDTYIMLSFRPAVKHTGTYINYGNISTFKIRVN